MKNTIKTLFAILAVVMYSHSHAQVVSIPDTNFVKALIAHGVDNNSDGQIQVSEAEALEYLELVLTDNILDYTGLNAFINVRNFSCNLPNLTTLDLSVLPLLSDIYCESTQFTILDLSGCLSLKNLGIGGRITMLNVSNCSALERIDCQGNQLTTLNASNCISLSSLYCSNNKLTTLNVSDCINLKDLDCSSNSISSLTLPVISTLKYLECENNLLKSLDLSGCINLIYINCSSNRILALDVNACKSLTDLRCSSNFLKTLSVRGLTSLVHLECSNNIINNLGLSGCTNLYTLYCSNNVFKVLDLMSCKNLEEFRCQNVTSLIALYFDHCPDSYGFGFKVDGDVNLSYICLNDYDDELKVFLSTYYYSGLTQPITIGSFCSSTSDGTFYTLRGNSSYDSDNNGCDSADIEFPNLKFKVNILTNSGYIFADANGDFSIDVPPNTYTITPQLNEYFVATPSSATVTLPDTILPSFCIAPNGIHHDVAITLVPLRPARPGFSDAAYKIVYTNKGTQTENGTVTFAYNESIGDYISATVSPNTIAEGLLTFEFSNLKIFESREIIVMMRTNSPSDTPPVNVGDILTLTAAINTTSDDENYDDNQMGIKQTVVGSYDPNDKTCLQGNVITPAIIGEYVDYLIRFENTGTAPAENVVITDYIDLVKFDISTLEITSTSHPCRTMISQGNKVQFVFPNIMLPYTEPDKHGYVAFKIKTLNTLHEGDSLNNKADIYFDYNLPVATNLATSIIRTPTPVKQNTYNIQIQLMPNPNDGNFVVRIKGKSSFAGQVKIYDLTGAEVYSQGIIHNDISTHTIHADLPAGIYQLQLQSDGNSWTEKLVIGQ